MRKPYPSVASYIGIMIHSLRLAAYIFDLHSSWWKRAEILSFMGTEMHFPFGRIYRVPVLKGIKKGPGWMMFFSPSDCIPMNLDDLFLSYCSINFFHTMSERQDTVVELLMEAGRSLASPLIHPFFLTSNTSSSLRWWWRFLLVCKWCGVSSE